MEKNLIGELFDLISWSLVEPLRRVVCAAEAKVLGLGGVTVVSQTTGVSRRAIHAGEKAGGDPESPLRWTIKSLRRLADELKAMGHAVSHASVGTLLGELGYSLQSNVKTLEGGDHPDRNAQFEYIDANRPRGV